MSLGPEIRAKGRVVADTGLYTVFYDFVPGFDGVRVPARYAHDRRRSASPRWPRLGRRSAIDRRAASRATRSRRRRRAIVLEAIGDADPDQPELHRLRAAGLAPLPPRVATGAAAPAVYRFIAAASAVSGRRRAAAGRAGVRRALHVLLDAPLEAAGQRLQRRRAASTSSSSEALKDVATRPDRAWQAIADSTRPMSSSTKVPMRVNEVAVSATCCAARGAREVAVFWRGPSVCASIRRAIGATVHCSRGIVLDVESPEGGIDRWTGDGTVATRRKADGCFVQTVG